MKKSTRNEVIKKVECIVKQPVFTLTNLKMMHMGISLHKVVVALLNKTISDNTV